MIQSLLIANRGEIACRIIRTARRLGIRTVAVYSDADAKALHVREADEAVHIGPSEAAQSYLVGEKIIAVAKESGAEAIHPGYGFLSENAEFAQAVIDAGLIWVGPKPDSIRAMGLKDAAKTLMDKAGVPTTPGYLGENQDADFLAEQAGKIGYPVLIKAVAGGGGKGMRKVDAAAEFADALVSCRREATASFGNDVVLIEKWIESPRHIEVQIFGDSHGNVVHLFERDCSLQRRHQKVIEEAPAPGMDEETRAEVCGAAVRAAKAVNYENAGTIEFIADASEGLRADRIWFMEMNTRLQVEHPVTEEITGQDLVEWQLRVASGEKLPCKQEELSITGYAVEARLYAENPANNFLPSTGPLSVLRLPVGYLRVDTGVEEGDSVSPFYDPMIAKLVSSGESRRDALDYLWHGLDGVTCWPVRTNAATLMRLVRRPEFAAGAVTTGFIADHIEDVVPPDAPSKLSIRDAASYFAAGGGGPHHPALTKNRIDPIEAVLRSPWYSAGGFRLNRDPKRSIRVQAASEVFQAEPGQRFEHGVHARTLGNGIVLTSGGQTDFYEIPRHDGIAAGAASDGAILSPMPGKIIAVSVAAGDSVAKGDKLVTLEAMKMEHSLTAPFDGTVAELNAEEGGQVSEGAVLVLIEGNNES